MKTVIAAKKVLVSSSRHTLGLLGVLTWNRQIPDADSERNPCQGNKGEKAMTVSEDYPVADHVHVDGPDLEGPVSDGNQVSRTGIDNRNKEEEEKGEDAQDTHTYHPAIHSATLHTFGAILLIPLLTCHST
jgi:hypothetical protein